MYTLHNLNMCSLFYDSFTSIKLLFKSAGSGVPATLAFWGLESQAQVRGFGGLRASAPVTMDSFFFGCELSGHTHPSTFKGKGRGGCRARVGLDHALPH